MNYDQQDHIKQQCTMHGTYSMHAKREKACNALA